MSPPAKETPAATPSPAPAATPSKTSIASGILAVVLWPFKMLWAIVLKTWGATVWFKNALLDYKALLITLGVGAVIGFTIAAYLAPKHPAAAPTKVAPVVASADTNKLAAQITVLSMQIANLTQILLKQPTAAQAPIVVAPVVAPVVPAVVETPAPVVKHRAAPKKAAAASGWNF